MTPDPTTALCRLCAIRKPIFQAGMGGIAGPALAAAVSTAGGLGHLGAIRMGAAALRTWITETRAATSAPFGVNLVPKGPGPDGFAAQVRVVLEERPAVVSLFWGDFADVIPQLKAAGIVVMVQVGSVTEARQAAADGADAVIAQGIEAGGHVRGDVGLLSLLPAVIAAVGPLPVLAAGGITVADDVRTAMQMGAAGVWVGTRFVASTESLAHDIYKQRLLDADTDATVHGRLYSYGWPLGTPYRVIPPRRRSPFRFMAGGVRNFDKAYYAETLSLYAGQGVGAIDRILPAAEIVAELGGARKTAAAA